MPLYLKIISFQAVKTLNGLVKVCIFSLISSMLLIGLLVRPKNHKTQEKNLVYYLRT